MLLVAHLHRASRSVSALFVIAFLDELASGLPIAGAGALSSSLALSAVLYFAVVFAAPTLFASLVETPLLAWSDRHRAERPRLIALALVGQAFGVVLEATASTPFVLGIGIAIYFPCSGLACGLAEAVVVDDDREHPERAPARWTLSGALGDIATPTLLFALAAFGLGFDVAALGSAVLVLAGAVIALGVDPARASRADVDDDEDEGEPVPLLDALRRAIKTKGLVAWLFATALCSLLDETLAAFTVLFAKERFSDAGMGELLLIAFAVGEVLATLVLARVVARMDPLRLLMLSGALSTLALGMLVVVMNPVLAALAALLVGVCAAPLYPLAKAQAYRALPDESGLVVAVERLFAPLDIVLPLTLAALADLKDPAWAIAAIALVPLALVALAWRAPSSTKGDAPVGF